MATLSDLSFPISPTGTSPAEDLTVKPWRLPSYKAVRSPSPTEAQAAGLRLLPCEIKPQLLTNSSNFKRGTQATPNSHF